MIEDDADALVSQAQNALLKTLEEPPLVSVFVLVSSRCSGRGPWSLARAKALSVGLSNACFRSLGGRGRRVTAPMPIKAPTALDASLIR